ncbi:SLAM family member 5-like [Thunnus maccoyii]|uniref:SLAM family member 5-like n=1 Tax=Thunnus maccoyii TaxID=8240 RepID=UPI001C4D8A8D|nr:SLAM family member 5-like [Thunnus maccoyii]
MRYTLICVLGLFLPDTLFYGHFEGTMAADPSMIHYRLKNSSICLHVKKPPPYQNSRWTFAGKAIISGNSINPNYTEKMDYEPKNLTLCVRDLNETNSGSYKVSFFDSNYTVITESHKVIVQDAVPRPVIRMSVLHSNLSARLCTITVNCSIWEDWVWSVCNEDGCGTSQRSLSRVNISISTDYRTVVCSGNNHVSTNNVSESVEATCFSKSNPELKEASQPLLVRMIVIAVFIILCTFIIFMAKKCCSTENNHHQTSNAQLMQIQPVEMQPQESLPRPRVSTSSSQADVTYENEDEPHVPARPATKPSA